MTPIEHADTTTIRLMLAAEIAALGQIQADARAQIAAELAALDMPAAVRTVTIPAFEEHGGIWAATVRLAWVCPVCGEPRGEPIDSFSFDGSRRLNTHSWSNACGHVDKYAYVRGEAKTNGLNGPAAVRTEEKE